ncbi:hypothetical protein ACVWXM_009504 [Bradyrhizobium sp. GM7.3]
MDDLAQLRIDCEVANKLWGRTFSGLSAITYREEGEDAVCELYVRVLRQHQTGHYREGLRKLGIRDDEPPAVAAAKYHYLTNAIGGLSMEYIEESPKKVWIRYIAPMWTFAGTAMMALPGSLRRKTFTAWHPRNGQLDCMSPPQNEATHPRCCDEGCLDGPGRASNKEGESWVIIPRSLSGSIRQNRAMQ